MNYASAVIIFRDVMIFFIAIIVLFFGFRLFLRWKAIRKHEGKGKLK